MLIWDETKKLLSRYTGRVFGDDSLGANLQYVNLRGANLQDTDLRGVNLQDADLRRANLAGANLQGANLTGANLTGANLTSANLTSTNLRGIILLDTKVEGTGIMSFKGSKHFAFYVPWQDYIQIGCVGMHTQEWLQTYEDVAAEYGYTREQIAEYLGFIQTCATNGCTQEVGV